MDDDFEQRLATLHRRMRFTRDLSMGAWWHRFMAARSHDKTQPRFERLRERLSRNHGRALGLPRSKPRTRYQMRLRSDHERRWRHKMLSETPF